jgi:hypothetical protein
MFCQKFESLTRSATEFNVGHEHFTNDGPCLNLYRTSESTRVHTELETNSLIYSGVEVAVGTARRWCPRAAAQRSATLVF